MASMLERFALANPKLHEHSSFSREKIDSVNDEIPNVSIIGPNIRLLVFFYLNKFPTSIR